jgi:hypothetical protein
VACHLTDEPERREKIDPTTAEPFADDLDIDLDEDSEE